MEVLFWCALLLGVFCIVYYIIIVLYAGMGVNFSWIWSLGGFGCISAAILLRYLINIQFVISEWLLLTAYILIGIALAIFVLLEARLLLSNHAKAVKGLDCLLVLGAQISSNKVTKNLKKRLDTATTYLLDNPDTWVIVSGGRGNGNLVSEAAVMKEYLLKQGIDSERVLMEEQSVNTTENMKYSKALISENAAVGIVTNGFHIYRSTRLAKKQGLRNVFALTSPTDRVMCLHYYVREAAGVLKDVIYGNL